jgi:uncharacterized protein YndB with AHSA1/START domain
VTTFASEETIPGTPQEIWEYATDITRHPEWMAVTDARIVRGDGMQAGTRGRERMRFGPFRWDIEFEVAEAVPGQRIVWKAIDGAPFDLAVSLDLAPVTGEWTKATYAADIRLRGPWRVLAPMVAIDGKSGPERELRRLKARFEDRTRGARP